MDGTWGKYPTDLWMPGFASVDLDLFGAGPLILPARPGRYAIATKLWRKYFLEEMRRITRQK
jgi:hypothetical protein